MLKARTPLVVGLLLIGAVVAFIFAFGSLKTGLDPADLYTVYARFDDASGLAPESRVVVAGIEVGKLGEPILDPKAPTKARVPLLLKKSVVLRKGVWDPKAEAWVNGAAVLRRQASLIGDYDVVLTPGLDGEVIPPGGDIPNVVSESGLGAIMKTVQDSSKTIFPKFEKITGDIADITGTLKASLVDDNGAAGIKQIRQDVAKITENVKTVTEEMREFLKTQVYSRGDDLKAIAQNLEKASAAIAQAAGPSVERIDKILSRVDRVAESIERFVAAQTAPVDGGPAPTVSKSLALLEGSMENIRKVTEKLEEGRGTLGRLLTDDKLVNDVEKIVSDVEDFTSTLTRTEIKVSFRTDYFVGRDAFKTTVDFAVAPSPDKYYLIQLIDDSIGKASRTTRVTTSNDPRVPPVLVEEIATTSNAFKLSAQFAKRWSWLTFRLGVLESTGGFGVDASLLDDALAFKLDVFEFGRDVYPHMRLLAQWEFLEHFFLSAGIDDMLNGPSRDWFVGLGLRFVDDDLKSVLPLLPSP